MFQNKDVTTPSTTKKLTISLNFSFICVILLIVIAVMLFLWKPWSGVSSSTRKVTVSGDATVKATPDEYQLSPYFEFDNADRTVNTNDASTKAAAISAKLKELGVKDTEIKSSTNSYDKYIYAADSNGTTASLQLTYTITLTSKDTAQKVQDYFLGLNAKGQISPQATFSEAKSKELAAQARTKAIEDAKSKGQKIASEVGAKLGKVITISDSGATSGGCGGGGGLCYGSALEIKDAVASSASIPVQSGENEFTATVSVEYQLR